jgi:hypothetical protein
MKYFFFSFIIDILATTIICGIYLTTADYVNITELVFCIIIGTLFFLVFFIDEYAAKKRNRVTVDIKVFLAKAIFLICFLCYVIGLISDIHNINNNIIYLIILKGNIELIIFHIIKRGTSCG